MSALLTRCDELLSSYPTTLDEDERILETLRSNESNAEETATKSSTGLSDQHLSMAVLYRREHKKFLRMIKNTYQMVRNVLEVKAEAGTTSSSNTTNTTTAKPPTITPSSSSSSQSTDVTNSSQQNSKKNKKTKHNHPTNNNTL